MTGLPFPFSNDEQPVSQAKSTPPTHCVPIIFNTLRAHSNPACSLIRRATADRIFNNTLFTTQFLFNILSHSSPFVLFASSSQEGCLCSQDGSRALEQYLFFSTKFFSPSCTKQGLTNSLDFIMIVFVAKTSRVVRIWPTLIFTCKQVGIRPRVH